LKQPYKRTYNLFVLRPFKELMTPRTAGEVPVTLLFNPYKPSPQRSRVSDASYRTDSKQLRSFLVGDIKARKVQQHKAKGI
jgi:hypothetical protein